VRKLFSAHSQPSPTWVKTIALKTRILLLSIFLSFSMGLGRIKQADAQSVGVMKSTRQSNLKRSASLESQTSRRAANDVKSRVKKTVQIELTVASKRLFDRKSFGSEGVIVASASVAHSTGSSAAEVSTTQPTAREVTSQEKVPKKRKRGSVVLKEEAEKEVKQSLYGLADSMKGKYVRAL
jgi:hypothetical protein